MQNLREYHRPETLEDALRLLSRDTARVIPLAGGTELVAVPPPDIDAVVDLNDLALDDISVEGDELVLGGLVRLTTLVESEEVRAFAGSALTDAARVAATSLLRNQGTLAGTLLTRLARSELPPVLLVLDAEVTLQHADGAEVMPLVMLYDDLERHTGGRIITDVRVPAPPAGARIHRQRVARTPADQPILAVTALTRVADAKFIEVRIAASGIGPHPRRLSAIESALLGTDTDTNAVLETVAPLVNELALPDDPLASAEYRRGVLPVLIRRVLLGE